MLVGLQAKLFAAGVVIAIITGTGLYIKYLRSELKLAELANTQYEDAIAKQKRTIEAIQKNVEQQMNINAELKHAEFLKSKELEELRDKFQVNAKGERRDFGAIASAKPKLMERLINRGTANAIRCLELASGAELNEKEKSAKNSKKANPECPRLINPDFNSVTN